MVGFKLTKKKKKKTLFNNRVLIEEVNKTKYKRLNKRIVSCISIWKTAYGLYALCQFYDYLCNAYYMLGMCMNDDCFCFIIS